MTHSMNDVSLFPKHVSNIEKKGKISLTRKKQTKEITRMLHKRCQSSVSDSLSSSWCFCTMLCTWPDRWVAEKTPLPKSWQKVMIDRHQMVHKKECLKHISWPSIIKSQVQDHFKALFLLFGIGICVLLYLVLGLRPIQCIRPSAAHTILYLRLVLLMNFRITLLQWDKAKKTLTQNEEDGNFDSPTEHALNMLGFLSQFECRECSSWPNPWVCQ